MLSSAAVRSNAVPNVVTVLRNVSSCPSEVYSSSGTATPPRSRVSSKPPGYDSISASSAGQLGGAAHRGLPPQPLDEVMAPLPEIADARRQPFGVQGDAQRVRPLEQVRRHAVEQHRGTGVGVHDLPAAVDHDARKWVVGVQNSLNALPHGGHVGVVE